MVASSISFALDAPRVAFGARKHRVQVWDYSTAERLCSLETILEGSRLGLCPTGEFVLTAAWVKEGIACYSTANSQLVWQRRDLKKVQRMNFSSDGELAFLGIEGRSCHAVEVRSGKTSGQFRGAKRRVDSTHTDHFLLDTKLPRVRTAKEKSGFSIPRETFAALDWIFGPDSLYVTESGGPLRCVSLADGTDLWRFQPDAGNHFLRLAFDDSRLELVGLLYPYEKGGITQVFRFGQGGSPRIPRDLPHVGFQGALSPDGTLVANRAGILFDTESGAEAGRLDLSAQGLPDCRGLSLRIPPRTSVAESGSRGI